MTLMLAVAAAAAADSGVAGAAGAGGMATIHGNLTVLAVALVVWGFVFFYLLRLERRIKDLERK